MKMNGKVPADGDRGQGQKIMAVKMAGMEEGGGRKGRDRHGSSGLSIK